MSSGGTKLFVTKYPYFFKERDIEDLFEKFGTLKDIAMKANYTFVEFEDAADAEDCIKEMDGKNIEGKRIVVELTKANNDRRGGGGNRGGDRRNNILCFIYS